MLIEQNQPQPHTPKSENFLSSHLFFAGFDQAVEFTDNRFDQTGDIFDLPVTVTLSYEDGKTATIVVPVWDRTTETRVPLQGVLRAADISKDDGTLAEISRVR